MPLYSTITVSSSIIAYIWKVEESESELSGPISLTPNCQERLYGMKSEIHRKGFLSIRHLLAHIGYTDFDLYYDSAGKPHLKDGRHISITHSNHFTAIIVSTDEEVGIDIEKQRDKILRIAHKYTPIEEYRTIANTEALIRKLTIVWGAKESIYKIAAKPGLSFIQNIYIDDFALSSDNTTGELLNNATKSTYAIKFIEFEGFTCVYAIKK
jgi:phosphopantetheinyl transferase